MKRCPQCDSFFSDTDQFCELDGTTLVVSEPPALAGAYRVSPYTPRGQNWKALAIVAVAAVAIGMALFVIYQLMTREAPGQNSNESSNEALTQQQIPFLPLSPSPSASASPSPAPSPSPSASPSPAAQTESTRAALSSSQISTSEDDKTRRGLVTILLTNGTSVEADEVWETGEGIWYRRRGVVTLLERDQVKAIERAIEKASPAPASPAPTPSSSPIRSP